MAKDFQGVHHAANMVAQVSFHLLGLKPPFYNGLDPGNRWVTLSPGDSLDELGEFIQQAKPR